MPKLLFLNRYFAPDESATSQLVSDLASEMAAAGYRVHVMTSRQRYEDAMADLPSREVIRGVSIHRIWTSRWGREGLIGRAVDYLTFYVSAGMWLLWSARRGDVIIPKTDPPLIGVLAMVVARVRGAHVVQWLQDLYPEVAEQLKVGGVSSASRFLKRLRNRSLRSARMNVVIGRCMAEHVLGNGIRAERVTVIPNWVDDTAIRPLPVQGHSLRRDWELGGDFVVGYSGNMGRVHEFETLIGAVSLLRENRQIRFLLIGAGARKNELRDVVEERGLSNVTFKPFQAQERLRLSLTVPDVHIVTLQHRLEGLIVPSKFYGAIAAGRPVIFVGPSGCEVARVIREWDCGFVVDNRDVVELAARICELRDDPERARAMGARARQAAEASFSREHALSAWRSVLDAVAQPRRAAVSAARSSHESEPSSG